jgi:hypothetical protein
MEVSFLVLDNTTFWLLFFPLKTILVGYTNKFPFANKGFDEVVKNQEGVCSHDWGIY